MTKNEKARLREIVRACRDELRASGRYTTSELYELGKFKYSEQLKACSEQWERSAFTTIHRELARQEQAFTGEGETQLTFPSEIMNIKIPASITVPYRTEDGDDEFLWTIFEEATLQEFHAYIGMLRAQIAADTNRLNDMLVIEDSIGNDIEDMAETMGSIFKRLFGRDQDAA